jgi:hypothetical protein
MNNDPFHGDRPIETEAEDRFGFALLGGRIAEALTTQAADKGFVMGIEGRWGSGKSSLLALIAARLREMDSAKVALVEFRPWLIGDRDQLLIALFEDLAKAIAKLEYEGGDATGVTTQAAKSVADQTRAFARHLGPLGKVVGLAGIVVPGGETLGKILEGLGAAAREVEDGPTLADQKAHLNEALRKLGCRIIVMIDDVDRLDPKEVAELLRLVRSVADFPNVSYLLCYDANTLAHAIETATGVKDGGAYLEKIVQTEISVPRPESFALRRWFSTELQSFVPCDQERASDLITMIGKTGGRSFDTARSVVRTLDSLRSYLPGLEGQVDIVDLAWIRIIAVASPALYHWIEEYVTEYAAQTSGRVFISDAERREIADRLDNALAADGLDWKQMQFELKEYLPGINIRNYDKTKEERLFSRSSGRQAGKDFEGRRLASPSHSRLYFSLAQPSDSISHEDIAEFVEAAHKGVNAVATLLLALSDIKGDVGTSKAERLFDLFLQLEDSIILTWPLDAVVMGLANIADELAKDERGDDWGYPRIWNSGAEFLKRLSRTLPGPRWEALILKVYEAGGSLGFVSHLLRAETFAQGFHGDRADPTECLISAELFKKIRLIMLARFRAGGLEAILGERQAITMLYAWSQAGGRDELVEQIEHRTQDDAELLAIMRAICSTSTSSDGIRFTLSLAAVEGFFNDPPEIARRVVALARADPPIENAQFVLDAITGSAHFHHSTTIERVIGAWEQRAPGDAGNES